MSDASTVAAQFGTRSYQEARNDYFRNGRDSLVNELEKYGLGPKDLVPALNLFTKVSVDAAGNLGFGAGHASAGDRVSQRFEMDCLVALTTCPHPLDPASEWGPAGVDLACRATALAGPDDPARCHCPENGRAFQNTERLYPFAVRELSA